MKKIGARRIGIHALIIVLALGVAVANAASVTTDKPDYAPEEVVIVNGSGFAPSTPYDIPIIRPDGSIVIGDGSFTPGWDTMTTSGSGSFTYLYQLDGIIGTYQVRVYPSPWSGDIGQVPLASTTFTDVAGVVDFRQCANQDPTLGDCHWINGILNTNNSEYFESMSVPQRAVFDDLGTTAGNVHTLTFSHQATKGGVHAYDFLTSYAQAITTASSAGVPFTDLNGQACAVDIGPPGTLGATCSSVRNGANCLDVAVPDDPFISKDGSTQARINAYELSFGNRTIRICGDSTISTASLSLSHSVANGMDTGDSEINYTLTWTSPSTSIVIEMGGHISLSGNPLSNPLAWGVGLGASGISGGPYHFNLSQLDGGSLGSQDNQIQGSATPTTTSTTSSSTSTSSTSTSTSTSATSTSSTSTSTSSSSTSTSSSSTSTSSSSTSTSSSSTSTSSTSTSTSSSSSTTESSSTSSSTSTSTSTSTTSTSTSTTSTSTSTTSTSTSTTSTSTSTSSTSTSSTSTTSTSSTTSTTLRECQHLKCYKARETSFPRFARRTVTLTDQFGTTTTDVTRPDRLCNPADKNGEGIGDPTVHGMCYRISEPAFARRNVLVDNQFGQQTLTVMSPESLCNPAEKDGIPFTAESNPNHFKCYKVRGQAGERFEERTVTVSDQFETKTTRVVKPLLLCNPVDKNGEGMPDPSCHLVCYRIRDAVGQAAFPPTQVTVEDQFSDEDLRTFAGECRKAGYLCVPSAKTELP